MSKTKILLGAIALSNLSLQSGYIEDEFTIEFGLNNASAQDMEVIEVKAKSGDIFTVPNYFTEVSSVGNDWDSDVSESREARRRQEALDRAYLCSLQPEGCDASNPPNIQPDGCSTEFAGVDFWNGWDSVFVQACNQHDSCFAQPGESFGQCNEELRVDLVDTCSAKNAEAASNGEVFNINECWDKSTEYYLGVEVFGSGRYAAAQTEGSCMLWIEKSSGSHCSD